MTPKQLRAFLAVAKTLSFAEAGAMVHLSQPALSLSIKKLEDSLGGPLLTRSTRSVALTPEGMALSEAGLRLLAEWDNTVDELQQRFALKKGKVAVAAMPSFAGTLLPKAMLAFREQHPNINIEVHDVIAERVVEMVQQGRIELGITFDPGNNEELNFTPLFDDAFIAVLPPGHTHAGCDEITWPRLLESDFITLQRPSTFRDLMERQLSEQGLVPRIAFDAHHLSTVGRMVATGLGVGAVPALCREQMMEQGASCARLVDPVISRQVGILTRRRHGLSVAAEELKQMLIEIFQQ